MIKAYCSDGSRVSEAAIKSNLSKAYRAAYGDNPTQRCAGCGGRAQGSMHLIPKARLKQLHLTELIWWEEMFLPGCYTCNSVAENITSEAFQKLLCYDQCIEIFKKYDPERYQKTQLFGTNNV